MERNCKNCGKELTRVQCRYCSRSCRYEKVVVNKPHFWDNVQKTGFCWNWKGQAYAYGFFTETEGERSAHRISFVMEHKRPIKKGYVICHRCDNPLCVRPDHLFEGTDFDNLADAFFKRRLHPRFMKTLAKKMESIDWRNPPR